MLQNPDKIILSAASTKAMRKSKKSKVSRKQGVVKEGRALKKARAQMTSRFAVERLKFLYQATTTLAQEPLNYQTRLKKLVKLIVPYMADWCIIDVPNGSELEHVAIAHSDPDKVESIKKLRQLYPPDPKAPHVIWRVIKTGRPSIATNISEKKLRFLCEDNDNFNLFKQLGTKSHIVVPLKARGEVLGAISFIYGRSDRHYTHKDLDFAKELAKRAAVSLESARLYDETKELLRTQRAARRQAIKAAEELVESEEKYRKLVEISPDAMVIHTSGKIVFANKAAQKLVGVDKVGDLIGRHVLDFVHPEYVERVRKKGRETFKKRGDFLLEEKLLRVDKTELLAEVKATPLTFNGKPSYLIIARDISAEKRSARMLEQVNRAALKFLSPFSVRETYKNIVQEAAALVGGIYGSVILEQQGELRRVYASDPFAFQTRNRRRSNTWRTFVERKARVAHISETGRAHPELRQKKIEWTIFIPLSYLDKSIGVLTVNREGLERPSKEELKLLELFGALASLSIKKAQLYEETKKALDLRDLFISMAAHEFRTPLTAINGYTELLKSRNGNTQRQRKRWLNQLFLETSRLTNLVDELLAVNRIKRGELRYEWKEINVRQVVKRAIKEAKFTHSDRIITFKDRVKDNQDLVIGDFDKLLQMISNLLDNADKFSPRKEKIVVELSYEAPNVVFTVKDKGKGIDKKDLPRIFQEFYKGGKNNAQGMGLGLFLSHHIINAHHGTIKIHSKRNKGTTAEVRLPKAMYD